MGHRDQFFGDQTLSQHGEDVAMLNLFWMLGVEQPSYLDLGCHHPMNISNTFLLYQRGCQGVAVDANPNLSKLWKEHRPRDLFLCRGVAGRRQNLEFAFIDDYSGRNTFSQEELTQFLGENLQFGVMKREWVEVFTPDEIKAEAKLEKWPELLSVDCEGFDMEILQAATFTKEDSPLVVCAEVRHVHRVAFDMVMAHKGYRPWARFISNVLYVRADKFHLVT